VADGVGATVVAIGSIQVVTDIDNLREPLSNSEAAWAELFAVPSVSFSLRAAAILSAYFVMGSIAAHAISGRWLFRLGPRGGEVGQVEALETLSDAVADIETRLGRLEVATQKISRSVVLLTSALANMRESETDK